MWIKPPEFCVTDHERAKFKRIKEDLGHFKGCRYYQKVYTKMKCLKQNKEQYDCKGCMVCPNCGGNLYTYSVHKNLHRHHLFITHAKSCAICGVYLEEQFAVPAEGRKHHKKDKCQVQGCDRIAHERIEHKVMNGEIQIASFIVCLTHSSQMNTWLNHPSKGISQMPLIYMAGKLIENPEYIRRVKVKK